MQRRAGALLGRTAAQAYFVLREPAKMAADDINDGPLISEIEFASVISAEFVVFHVGQFAAH